MAPKVKAPAGTKAKAKASDKEATKKAKVVKTATKGKFNFSIYASKDIQRRTFRICD